MTDPLDRERMREGLRLMRAFFHIEDRERRRLLVDFAEGAARESLSKPVRLFAVDLSSQAKTTV